MAKYTLIADIVVKGSEESSMEEIADAIIRRLAERRASPLGISLARGR